MNTMSWLQDGAAWAWHTSLVIAIPGLILLALGRWRGFSPRWRMLFAGALLFRLLLPFVPELPWHPVAPLEHALSINAAAPQVHVTPQVHEEIVLPSVSDEAAPVASFVPQTAASAILQRLSWPGILAGMWIIGVIGVGGWLAASHWLIRRWVSRHAAAPDEHVEHLFQWCCGRMGLRRRIGLVEMPRMATAAVCGWLKPIVLVPANLRQTHTDDEIRGILLHELAHVRRCDVLWSWLGLAACALHWFNPFAWLALRRFHADRELECDRMALAHLTVPQRTAYAPALFKTLQGPTLATSAALVPFFRHKHEIHNRILTIMKPTKSLAARLAALLFVPALSVFTLTTAGADDEKKPIEETPTKQRDGEGIKKGPRDGEVRKEGPRDGEPRKELLPPGEKRTKELLPPGEEKRKKFLPEDTASRDAQVQEINAKIAALEKQRLALLQKTSDGDANVPKKQKVLREGDADVPKKVLRDGDGDVPKKEKVLRDGELKKEGQRDGEVRKFAPRDGEVKKEGPRDGEVKKEGPRDGEVKKEGARDGETPKRDGDR